MSRIPSCGVDQIGCTRNFSHLAACPGAEKSGTISGIAGRNHRADVW